MPATRAHLLPILLSTLYGCTVGAGGDPDAGAPAEDAEPAALRLVLEPSEVTLESVDGSMPSVTFEAFARSLSGERFEVEPMRWDLSHGGLGSIDADGTFTASGRAGGTVEAIATVQGAREVLVARATVTVRLDLTVPPDPSLPADVRTGFDEAPEVDDPFTSASLVYPLDGARMPNNVGAPDLQWRPVGGVGDAYRVTASAAHVVVRAFVHHDGAGFGWRHRLDPSAFRALADSARGGEIELRVDRLPASRDRVVRGNPIRVWLSEDGVFGTLYYWQVRARPERSDIYRLDAATSERASVFSPDTGRCVGCHALSQDGRRLAATLGGNIVPWSTAVVDAASAGGSPVSLLDPLVPSLNSLAFRPGGGRILASRPVGLTGTDSELTLLDGATGAEVDAAGLPSGPAGYPAWSPDGARVAWMEGGGDGPEGTIAPTRVVIADVEAGDTFRSRVLHDGADLSISPEGGATDSRPTFSPDSRFVAFAHGTRSISSIGDDGRRPRASLYLVPAAGGEPIRLERGMGREGPVDAFWPVFSPFATQEEDGTVHYWLAFYSRQDYGNVHAGTRGTGRRQLWVMAIDPALAEAGADPSYPPYWLPGQDTEAEDIAALWAPTACRGRGESCAASSECCSGECAAADPSRPDELTCRPPSSCHRAGEPCETVGDCCDGLECNLGVCGYEPPV